MIRALLGLVCVRLAVCGNTNTCIQNTGGTCLTTSCASWRGQTTCDGGRCFCTGGTCAGSDEQCYPTTHLNVPYPTVTSGGEDIWEIQNSRWPEYFLYVQMSGGVRSSTDHDGDTSDFTIKTLPNSGGAGVISSYLMLSRKWPDFAMCMSSTSNDNKNTYTPVTAGVKGGLGGMLNDPAINTVALTFTKAPVEAPADMKAKNQTLVMLSTPKYAGQYMYLSTTGWQAKAWTNDPGAGGYWYIKTVQGKPLPKAIQDKMLVYNGPRCSSFCGTVQSKAFSANSVALAALALVVAFAARE